MHQTQIFPVPLPWTTILTKRQGHSPHEAITSTTEGSVLLRMGRVCFFLPGQLGHKPLEGELLITPLRKTRVPDTEAKTAAFLASFQEWEGHLGWSRSLQRKCQCDQRIATAEGAWGTPNWAAVWGRLTSPAAVTNEPSLQETEKTYFELTCFHLYLLGFGHGMFETPIWSLTQVTAKKSTLGVEMKPELNSQFHEPCHLESWVLWGGQEAGENLGSDPQEPNQGSLLFIGRCFFGPLKSSLSPSYFFLVPACVSWYPIRAFTKASDSIGCPNDDNNMTIPLQGQG